ncbi:LysE family translocator [Aquimarina agarivorans]|uniref:LysE family translocator n=1 Tax=Aquimarina agarivorans TaxID=980584 RepID=UPI000248E823|nr:LysE family transporter [Aquimarina agarivorans]
MISVSYIILGLISSILGSILPSFLNLTVIKFNLKYGKKSSFYLIFGICFILFFQANLGAYLSSVLVKNSEYIHVIQKVGIGILLILSFNFFRKYFTPSTRKINKKGKPKNAFVRGLWISFINTFAIPFYFLVISFLTELGHFTYSLVNSMYFSLGSITGSLVVYTIYAIVASKIEKSISHIATKMDLVLGCVTGIVGLGNLLSYI